MAFWLSEVFLNFSCTFSIGAVTFSLVQFLTCILENEERNSLISSRPQLAKPAFPLAFPLAINAFSLKPSFHVSSFSVLSVFTWFFSTLFWQRIWQLRLIKFDQKYVLKLTSSSSEVFSTKIKSQKAPIQIYSQYLKQRFCIVTSSFVAK